MPRVTILRREQTVHYPAPRQAEEVVAVTFVTDAYGVRSVNLPVGLYRVATPEEVVATPRYRMVPIDPSAEADERKAIQEAIKRETAQPPASFDLP